MESEVTLYRDVLPQFIPSLSFSVQVEALTLLSVLIFCMGLYSAVRYLAVRDTPLLLLSPHLLLLAAFWYSVAHGFSPLLSLEESIFGLNEPFFISTLTIASLLPFCQSYLSARYLSPGNYTFILIITVGFITTIMLGALGYWTVAMWAQFGLVGLTLVSLLVISIVIMAKGFPPSLYYLGGHCCLIVAIGFWILPEDITDGWVVSNQRAIMVASGLQAILMTVGSEFRINFLKSKKEQAKALAAASHKLVRYFPKKTVDKILSSDEPVALNSQRQQVTIFFTDLANFTDLTDKLEPERMTAMLNQYLGSMVRIINRYDGTLDKFIGDGIMALFGAPDEMDPEEQAQNAVNAGLMMHQRFDEMAEQWQEEGIDHNIKLRIGINQDFITLGNFGSNEHMSYTAIGNGVNLASRLERACPPGKIMVSNRIYSYTKDSFPYEEVKERPFKGFKRTQHICELNPQRYFNNGRSSSGRKLWGG